MCNSKNHPPGCDCGFGLGWNTVEGYGLQGMSRASLHALNDFTRPTRCHYCHAPVFFVRHNGGSVWFDELGKPWPKHPCYYKPMRLSFDEGKVVQAIDQWLKRMTNPMMGIVIAAEYDRATKTKYLIVHCTDEEVRKVSVYVTFSLDSSVGEMVMFSEADGFLVRPYLNTETILPLSKDFLRKIERLPPSKAEQISTLHKKRRDYREICNQVVRVEQSIVKAIASKNLLLVTRLQFQLADLKVKKEEFWQVYRKENNLD